MNVIWILLATYTIITVAQSDTISVPTEESEPSSICVKNIDLFPRNISTNLDIKIGKDHLELTVCNDDKFDYFKVPWNKCSSCSTATGLNVNLINSSTDGDNKICHGYSPIDDKSISECYLQIFDDKGYIVLYIIGYTKNVYAVHKETGEITGYLSPRAPHDESDDTDQFLSELNECLDKQYDIPKSLPISFDITKRNSHIEILAFSENHYDFYKINWEGIPCYKRIGDHRKPNYTMGVDNKQCDK